MSDDDTIRILGFAGSLRKASYNKAALRAAQELAPPGMTIETFDLAPIPIYNDDVRLQGYPPPAAEFRARIKAAEAVLIATPEYNHSIPGGLKNAIDWASRPPEQPFNNKPVGLMSASPGALGGVRAQMHLRQCFLFLNAPVMGPPEVLIGNAPSRFDSEGKLTDEPTREFIRKLLEGLAAWTKRLRD